MDVYLKPVFVIISFKGSILLILMTFYFFMLKLFKNDGSKTGFTLIELLVVIAIIGILASVVLASLNSARKKSRDARRLADIKQLQVALELYYDANNADYPGLLSSLIGATACGSSSCISVVPTPPGGSGQTAYAYSAFGSSATDCSSYHLGAVMEETSNPALSSDADAAVSTQTLCTSSAPDFSGSGSTDCAGTPGTDACYDVKP